MRATALLVFLLGFHFAIGQNLIVNPGAELDPLTNGWSLASGNWTSGTERTPHGGVFHFYPGDNSTGGSELYQDVNVSAYATSIDLGLSTFTFTTWMRVYSFVSASFTWNDNSRTIVEYRNGSGTVLSSYDTNLQNTLVWTSYTDSRTAPVGTRTIRIRLIATRNSGTAADGYFDDLSLTHSSPLPVSLLSFQGHVMNKSIVLNWKTSEEKSNAFFTIEKSANGIDWETIGTVNGSATSYQLLSYSFADNNPISGIQYYRLKQTDVDGTSTSFQIISVAYSSSIELVAFPNPTTGFINLIIPDTNDGVVRVYSMTGQEVFSKEIRSGNLHTLDLTGIVSGVYHLEYTSTGKVSRLLLRKE